MSGVWCFVILFTQERALYAGVCACCGPKCTAGANKAALLAIARTPKLLVHAVNPPNPQSFTGAQDRRLSHPE